MHIVIFTGGSYPQPHLTEQYFSSFLPDYVIAADSGLEALESYAEHFSEANPLLPEGCLSLKGRFFPSEILGDMDSLKNSSLLKKYADVPQKRFIEDKDYTDTELALESALSHQKSLSSAISNPDRITLVGAGGTERLDHLLGVFDLFSTDLRPDVWLSGNQAAYYICEGQKVCVSGMTERENLSFARLSFSRTEGVVKSSGLLWESDCFRKEGLPSISNRLKPDFIERRIPAELTVCSGRFLLLVPLHAKVEITGPVQES